MKEFRGHNYMAEIDPNGTQTEHWFHQGEAVTSTGLPDTDCVPTITGDAIPTGLCFQRLRDGEFLKGREYQTHVRASAGGTLLQETIHSFSVSFLGYSSTPLAGLWRAFTAETQTESKQYEGGGRPLTKTTKYFYDLTGYQPGSPYGNLNKQTWGEMSRGTL